MIILDQQLQNYIKLFYNECFDKYFLLIEYLSDSLSILNNFRNLHFDVTFANYASVDKFVIL